MGNNYACIHIRTEDIEKTSSRIIEMYDTTVGLEGINPLVRDEYLKIVENAKLLGNSLLNSVLRIDNDVTILETNGMVSVYDKNLSFETVVEKAKEISRKVAEPVLYLSGFDGDIFIFGVLKKGKLCTNGVVGETPQDYGVDECCADMSILRESLCFPVENLERLFNETDDVFDLIENLQQEFERLLEVPLNFRRDWISLYEGAYQKKRENNGVVIYERS